MRALLATLSLFTLLWVSDAHALEYQYEAPPTCPDENAFVQATRGRLEHPEARSSVERLVVTVVEKHGFHAELTLFEAGYAPVTREVTASDCEQAVRAIALAAALALDARYTRGTPPAKSPAAPSESPPSAAPEPAPPSRSDAPEKAEAPEPLDSASPEPTATEPAEPALPRAMRAAEPPPPPPAPPPPTPKPKEASEARTLFLRTAWGLFLATGYSPKPTLGPVLELALERDPAILAVRGFFGFESTSSKRDQRARFWVWGARLLPCYAPSITSDLSLAGCASLEHARVMTRGLENSVVVQGKRGNTPFWALGASLGVRLGLRRRLSVHADLGGEFPLVREKFAFTNEDGSLQPLLHRYPWLAARVEVGIGQSW